MDSPASLGISTDYFPVPGSESDDTQSFASHSDGNENLPSIVYTSDDSADVGPPVLNYTNSDLNLIAHNINHKMEDEISQQFLLESENPSPQADTCFISHPLSSDEYTNGNQLSNGVPQYPNFMQRNQLFVDQTLQGQKGLLRCNSSSSTETTESTPECTAFLAQYEPLSLYCEDDNFEGTINFEALKDDPVKARAVQDRLNLMDCEKPTLTRNCKRWFVGNVHIDADFKDVFFVNWNWKRIRHSCVFLHMSLLLGLLCAAVALLIKMPQGSDCNPARQWWQGSVAYEIFVPSFQDSDGDGIGDIPGVISRLDYLIDLGVKIVRLAPIFESDGLFDGSFSRTNHTGVMKSLGSEQDIQQLAQLLHEKNMYLILDIPLTEGNASSTEPSINLLNDVPSALTKWLRLGVDGFAFGDIDRLLNHQDVLPALHRWRNILDSHSQAFYRRIMMVPLGLLERQSDFSYSVETSRLLSIVDMIDVHLDLSVSAERMSSIIKAATQWSSSTQRPWISWRLGGVGHPRLFEQMPRPISTTERNITAIGSLILQMYLPGSVTIYYGDEIDLRRPEGVYEDLGWASPMVWTNNSKNGGFSNGDPWIPLNSDWKLKNVASLSSHLDPLKIMIKATQEEVPMYANGITSEEGPKQNPNYKIRLADETMFVLERFYPRRNSYTVVVNLGLETQERDLSKLYYGGKVLASSHGKEGYVHFKNITLMPGEALACILDK